MKKKPAPFFADYLLRFVAILTSIVEKIPKAINHLLISFIQGVIFMSHTLQTAIAFPIVMGILVIVLSGGPILYQEASTSASFHRDAVLLSLDNHKVISQNTIEVDGQVMMITCSSPERMHSFVRAISDSATLLIEGVAPA